MTSDSDDALSWDGDEGVSSRRQTPKDSVRSEASTTDRSVSGGGHAIVEGPDASDEIETEPTPLSTAMLLILGVVGGIYLLYSVGWVAGGLRLKPLANLIVADAMYVPWFGLAVAAPALWFLAVWVLTRRRAAWIRVGLLLLGVVLLVPWPVVTVGVVGA